MSSRLFNFRDVSTNISFKSFPLISLSSVGWKKILLTQI
jgi:hypothetical protein